MPAGERIPVTYGTNPTHPITGLRAIMHNLALPCPARFDTACKESNDEKSLPTGRADGKAGSFVLRVITRVLSRASMSDLLGALGIEVDAHFARFTGLERNGFLTNLLLAVALDDRANRVGRPL